jgi:hypothetical protein
MGHRLLFGVQKPKASKSVKTQRQIGEWQMARRQTICLHPPCDWLCLRHKCVGVGAGPIEVLAFMQTK